MSYIIVKVKVKYHYAGIYKIDEFFKMRLGMNNIQKKKKNTKQNVVICVIYF